MTITMTIEQDKLQTLISNAVRNKLKAKKVTSLMFKIEPVADSAGNPTDTVAVSCVVEAEIDDTLRGSF